MYDGRKLRKADNLPVLDELSQCLEFSDQLINQTAVKTLSVFNYLDVT